MFLCAVSIIRFALRRTQVFSFVLLQGEDPGK